MVFDVQPGLGRGHILEEGPEVRGHPPFELPAQLEWAAEDRFSGLDARLKYQLREDRLVTHERCLPCP